MCFLFSAFVASGQKKISHKDQLWVGYMTSARLSERYSLWNDVHIVPGSFAIARTGLTRTVFQGGSLTGGYAFLFLPGGSGDQLKRREHRPWAQFQLALPAGVGWTMTQRIRYDARFKEDMSEGEPASQFRFNHRVRFLVTFRKDLTKWEREASTPYVAISNEVLLNFGKEITYNTFDQNRLSLSIGVQKEKTQYQLGIMNRFVQTGPSTYTLNHTLVLWLTQKFDLRNMGKHHNESSISR